MQIMRSIVTEALADANLTDGEDGVNVRADYSGRGMYGQRCFGVDFRSAADSYRFLMALGFAIARNDEAWGEENALRVADAATTDSMGLGMILYFPGCTLLEDTTDADTMDADTADAGEQDDPFSLNRPGLMVFVETMPDA